MSTLNLLLYNLEDPTGEGDFEFTRFPRSIHTEDAANWEQLDVASFVKPLSFANTDPQVIEIPEVWLDNSDTGDSVLPEIEQLRALMRRGERGAPPRLQLICGDWEATVVLKRMSTERTRFTPAARQVRARLSLSFVEVQSAPRSKARPQPGNRPEDAAFSF